jgi:hypothetical protein
MTPGGQNSPLGSILKTGLFEFFCSKKIMMKLNHFFQVCESIVVVEPFECVEKDWGNEEDEGNQELWENSEAVASSVYVEPRGTKFDQYENRN